MRKTYWYISAYIKKHGVVVLLTVLIASILFSFFLPALFASLEKTNRKYIGIIGEYSLSNLPKEITSTISAGLTQVLIDGSVQPMLAERWTTENEGKTYRFILKQDIFWQDGKPLVPSDIQYNLNESEVISTANDIVFKLPDAYAPFPTVVSEPLLRFDEEKKFIFFKQPKIIGIGKFSISDISLKGNQITELVVDGPSERTTYRFYLTEGEAVIAYKHGLIDEIKDLSKDHDIMSWPNTITEKNLQKNRYLAVFFNTDLPIFDKNIRQGLAYALEKPADETRAIGPISPDSWAYLPGGKSYEKDWDRGSERVLSSLPPEPLSFELKTTPLFISEAEHIKAQWESFGEKLAEDCQKSSNVENKDLCQNVKIDVSIKVANFPDTNEFQALLVGQETESDPDQYALWHSDQGTNFTHFKSTRVDDLLERGRKTTDQATRKEIYQEFQQFFLEDSPAVFLKHLQSYNIKRK